MTSLSNVVLDVGIKAAMIAKLLDLFQSYLQLILRHSWGTADGKNNGSIRQAGEYGTALAGGWGLQCG